MIKNTKENADRIAEEGRIERESKTNALQLKLREIIQKDDYTKINKYGEGMCWGCMRIDQVISSLWDACGKCIAKRGAEGIMAKTKTKPTEELCDFCGSWEGGRKGGRTGNFVSQINISMCRTCQERVHSLHKQYQQGGGREALSPYYRYLVKKHGKEWKDILMDGITTRRF
ncbi:MAG: hypothetical protein KGH87_07170 [Thaumarchaeota archaeon]|nr:hypothetical protein [Nitrososphaerota archaeon]